MQKPSQSSKFCLHFVFKNLLFNITFNLTSSILTRKKQISQISLFSMNFYLLKKKIIARL